MSVLLCQYYVSYIIMLVLLCTCIIPPIKVKYPTAPLLIVVFFSIYSLQAATETSLAV